MAKKKAKSKAKLNAKSNPTAEVLGQRDDFLDSLEREIAAEKQKMFAKFMESPEELLNEPPRDITDPVSYFGPGNEHEETEEEINSASDRNAAILAASRLEWRVKQVVKARLCVADKTADTLLGTDTKKGDLDFSEQCKLAYCLGLVGPAGLRDLARIGTIRNKFAHNQSVRTFSNARIKQSCAELETPKIFESTPGWTHPFLEKLNHKDVNTRLRVRFLFTSFVLWNMLWGVLAVLPVKWPKISEHVERQHFIW